MGIFLMLWSAKDCLRKFEDLAKSAFHRREHGSILLSRLQQFVLSYFEDCQYSSAAIESAFRTAFGAQLRMFNPLTSDTKVAVTSTAVGETLPCLFSNYNGGHRPRDTGSSRRSLELCRR